MPLNMIISKKIWCFTNGFSYNLVHGGSGGPYISGWTITLFPYLENNAKNYYVWNKSWQDAYDEPMFGGLVTSNFPATLSRVSFKWKYYNQEFDMLFLGGFMGINYDQENKILNPVFGYSVCQDTKWLLMKKKLLTKHFFL